MLLLNYPPSVIYLWDKSSLTSLISSVAVPSQEMGSITKWYVAPEIKLVRTRDWVSDPTNYYGRWISRWRWWSAYAEEEEEQNHIYSSFAFVRIWDQCFWSSEAYSRLLQVSLDQDKRCTRGETAVQWQPLHSLDADHDSFLWLLRVSRRNERTTEHVNACSVGNHLHPSLWALHS